MRLDYFHTGNRGEEIIALHPDVALLDVRLPDGDGVSVCRELRSDNPELKCLMLTSFADDEALFDAILAEGRTTPMMLAVAFSFILLGVITVVFLSHQYANTNKAKRQAMMQVVSRAIQQNIKESGMAGTPAEWRAARESRGRIRRGSASPCRR